MLKAATVLTLALLAVGGSAKAQNPPPGLTIRPNGSQPSTVGAAATFTGHVVVTPLFAVTPSTRAAGASVSFSPGARSAWHSHPAGQTLIVTQGVGWIQAEGGVRQDIKPDDVIWTPPGVRHWHGATASTAMTHIAIQEQVDGNAVTWMEHVPDAQYLGQSAR